MSILDKITGRAKKAAGDLAGDQRCAARAPARSARARPRTSSTTRRTKVEDKANEVADLERKT